MLVLFILHWIFPTGLFDINSMQLDIGGDGMKNYFTFAYTVKYDQFPWFDAFLYPAGDLGMYMDNQPLLSYFCSKLKYLGLYDPNHSSAWLSWFNILGFVFAIPVIYKICKYFSLPVIWAGLVTFFCIVLSPQLYRMAGHYGLAYAFVIPLNWFFVLQIIEEVKIRRFTIYIILLNILVSGIHPYMLLMNVIVIGAYWLSYWLIKKRNLLYLLISMIIPIVLFLIVTSILDPIKDRGQSPNGAWFYKTELGDLLPFFGIYKWFAECFTDISLTMEDGYAYVGPLVFIFLIAFFTHWIFKKINYYHSWPKLDMKIKLALSASLLILAFAMGIHLIITDKKIMDWIPQLANFRALGRFSWGFYYMAFILLFVWFYRMTKAIRSKGLRQTIIIVVLLLYAFDSYGYCLGLKQKLEKYGSKNVLIHDKEIFDIVESKQVNLEKVQAIISLPLSTEGVEKLGFGEYYSNKVKVFPFAYQTGIPMTSTTQSRASVERIFKSLQFTNSKFGEFTIGNEIDNEKQFLVVILKDIKSQYRDVLDLANYIGETEKLELWLLDASELSERHTFLDYAANVDAWCKDSCDQIVTELFDEHATEGLHSLGAFRSKNKYETIGSWDIAIDTNSVFEFSFWQFVEAVKGDVAEYYIEVRSDQGEVTQRHTLDTRHKDRVEVNGQWVRFYSEIELGKSARSISLAVSHHDMVIDWLTIKPKGIHFYTATDSSAWLYCDHYFMKPE